MPTLLPTHMGPALHEGLLAIVFIRIWIVISVIVVHLLALQQQC